MWLFNRKVEVGLGAPSQPPPEGGGDQTGSAVATPPPSGGGREGAVDGADVVCTRLSAIVFSPAFAARRRRGEGYGCATGKE